MAPSSGKGALEVRLCHLAGLGFPSVKWEWLSTRWMSCRSSAVSAHSQGSRTASSGFVVADGFLPGQHRRDSLRTQPVWVPLPPTRVPMVSTSVSHVLENDFCGRGEAWSAHFSLHAGPQALRSAWADSGFGGFLCPRRPPGAVFRLLRSARGCGVAGSAVRGRGFLVVPLTGRPS